MDEKRVPADDIKKDADVLVARLVDAGRACEQYFLQKHLQVSTIEDSF